MKRDGQNPAYRPSGEFMEWPLAFSAAAPYTAGSYGSAEEIG